MRIHRITRRKEIDVKDFIGRKPDESEMGEVIDEDFVLYENNIPVLAYTILPRKVLADMRTVVKTTDYQVSNRVEGIPTKSSVFGAMPRSGTRCDFCRFTQATRNEMDNFVRILDFRDHVAGFYRKWFPDGYCSALADVQQGIHTDWSAGVPSPWLTCNINVNFAIPYHRDAGNVSSQLSNVIIIRNKIRGGELVCPEFGISLSQRDGAMTIFDGRSILHGVRPIERLGDDDDTYRASIVYYTMSGMKNCQSMMEEVERIQTMRTAKERVPNEVRKQKVADINRRVLARESKGG